MTRWGLLLATILGCGGTSSGVTPTGGETAGPDSAGDTIQSDHAEQDADAVFPDTAGDGPAGAADTISELPQPQGVDVSAVEPAADTFIDSLPEVSPDTPHDTPPADTAQPPVQVPDWIVPVFLPSVELDDDGKSGDLQAVLPEGTTSFTLSIFGYLDPFYGLRKMVTPKGKIIVKPSDTGSLCITCDNWVHADQGVMTALFPATPTVQIAAGKYTFSIDGKVLASLAGQYQWLPAPGKVDVLLLAKTGGSPQQTGSLSVNLFFTGVGGVTAATAPSDGRVASAVEQLQAVYSQIGVAVSVGGYFDASPEYQVIESTIGYDSDLALLLQQSAGAPANGVNVFFVQSIFAQDPDIPTGSIVLGISPWPGPPFLTGSQHSGVAVTWLDPGGGPDYLGPVIAHEVGHFLGLYHTTELSAYLGTFHDQIPDTAEDDPTNVMFWMYSAEGVKLTPQQGEVVRGYPMVGP